MIEKFKGIVLKVADYKDSDKLATIFSLEYGVLTARFVGVKREKAKYKAVAQPFVFANFVVAEKGKSLTITQADTIDCFQHILQNYNKTICAYIVLDIVRSILPELKTEQDIFLITLNALKNIEMQNEYVATIEYILNFLKFSGLQLVFADAEMAYLDTISGNFIAQKQENSVLIDKKVYLLLKNTNNSNIDGYLNGEININVFKQALHLLHNIIFLKFGADIKSFTYI